ncbi:MAG: helix-turn-helix transcriptional regulator [Oscillospiraceae bacterium]
MFDNNKMKNFILDKGIKQKKISEITGIPESVISLILSGKRKCSIEEYVSLCFALNVPIGEFIQNNQKAS